MTTYIAVKEHSARCPRKNHTLLPYVLDSVKDYLDVVVITDSQEMAKMCKDRGISYYIEDNVGQESEFHSIYRYLSQQGIADDEELMILPVTQPFRTKATIDRVACADMDGHDVVTTYTTISNRRLFLLNDDDTFAYPSYHRTGCMCPQQKMADGAIYKMRYGFLRNIIEGGDTNHLFWHSRLLFVENTAGFFLDVDEPQDLSTFLHIAQ